VTPTTGTEPRFRPRYARMAAFAGAVVSTLVTVSAGTGLLPSGGAPAQAAYDPGGGTISLTGEGDADATADDPATDQAAASTATPGEAQRPGESAAAGSVPPPPADSGEGRRVVFDPSQQRVWLVDDDDEVRRSHLASGSKSDNLRPGTYEVYSRSRDALGIDGSTMGYMVRFTAGDNAPIGFHDIPLMDGEPVQTRAELGTPLSHGCIRQARRDAVALWRFAPVGTTVVVTA
jgi:lipoprotein-anchoring transpeptidase ErfK/SrfK